MYLREILIAIFDQWPVLGIKYLIYAQNYFNVGKTLMQVGVPFPLETFQGPRNEALM